MRVLKYFSVVRLWFTLGSALTKNLCLQVTFTVDKNPRLKINIWMRNNGFLSLFKVFKSVKRANCPLT